MASFNKVYLMGNLTRDPELKYTPNNHAVVNIGLAVNRRYSTSSGERREEVTFVDCEAWGRTAEVINQYLRKGRPIFIEGRLKLETWQDQQGQNRSRMRVVIEGFQFIDGGGGSGQGGGGAGPGDEVDSSGGYDNRRGAPAPGGHSGGGGMGGPGGHQPMDEDDIPF